MGVEEFVRLLCRSGDSQFRLRVGDDNIGRSVVVLALLPDPRRRGNENADLEGVSGWSLTKDDSSEYAVGHDAGV